MKTKSLIKEFLERSVLQVGNKGFTFLSLRDAGLYTCNWEGIEIMGDISSYLIY